MTLYHRKHFRMLNVVAGVYDISPQPGQIFYNDTVDKTRFNIGEHLLEAGTVEVRTRCAIVNVGLYHNNLRVCGPGSPS